MKYPPVYQNTERIRSSLYDIDTLKAGFGLHTLSEETITYLRRKTILKSSLYSARIEGNTLEEEDMTNGFTEETQEKREVANLSRAYDQVFTLERKKMSIPFFKDLHKYVMEGLTNEVGLLRTEESAIYNQSGLAIYLSPAPQRVPSLLQELCEFTQTSNDPTPITAGISHIWFEKIHPFLDGNGRVGRLLSSFLLAKGGYGFDGLVPLEEYFDRDRDKYYHALSLDTQNVTQFVEFFLSALYEQTKKSLTEAVSQPKIEHQNLLPRRAELLAIIKDHGIVSFDFIKRRFRAIPERTLHYDLAQLVKSGHIKKLGNTNGVVYSV